MNNIKKLTFYFIITFCVLVNLSYAQSIDQEKGKSANRNAHHEILDDEYVPVYRENQQRSPAYHYSMNNVTTIQVNVDANGLNIVGDAANEPSIAVDPNNRNIITIGWRQFNTVTNNFRQAGYGYTTDGGLTWTFPGVIESGIFRSDPVLDADVYGNIYYNSLTNDPDFFCKVFKSSTGGSSWDAGTDAHGGDKQWMTIDKINGPGLGHIYAYWTSFYSVCSPDFFTRSTNFGATFENCISIPNEPYWGTLAVGPGGELYIGGTIGFDFQVAKSLNAQHNGQIITWDMTTIVNLDGTITSGGYPNPGGLMGQTSIAVDTSSDLYNGNVYLLCTVDRNSVSDPADVMFARSTDGGTTWSSPVRINDDPGTSAYQWFGTMSVGPTGRIDVIWLDTRENAAGNISALYYSNSKDAGLTWSPNEKLSDNFNSRIGWPNQNKMGDYFDMVSDSNGASLAWAATFNGEQDVYYSYILDSTGTVPVELTSFSGYVSSHNVTLLWSTATELNNHGFEIERSVDMANWITIGFREGSGTTSEPQQYSYLDNLSEFGAAKFYYRLKQIDFIGDYEYSKIVEIYLAPSAFSLGQNYPNPFNPSTTISYQLPVNSFVSLKVYDIIGNEIASLVNEEKLAGEYQVEFNASDMGSRNSKKGGYTSGIYFYTLIASDPSTGSEQIFFQSKKMILLK